MQGGAKRCHLCKDNVNTSPCNKARLQNKQLGFGVLPHRVCAESLQQHQTQGPDTPCLLPPAPSQRPRREDQGIWTSGGGTSFTSSSSNTVSQTQRGADNCSGISRGPRQVSRQGCCHFFLQFGATSNYVGEKAQIFLMCCTETWVLILGRFRKVSRGKATKHHC